SEGLVARSVQMTALRPPLSEDMVQAQVACIGWLGRCHGDAVDVCEGLLQLVKLHAGEKGAFSRRVLVAAFEAIFEVFGADDNPAADSALRGCADPGWEELLEAGVRRLKREAQNCDEEDVEGAAVNGEAFIESGVPPVAKAGELGEAIAALWGAIKGRIRYRAAAPPATALSPLPESSMGRTRSRKPLQTVVEGSERVEEAENTLRSDDLSEDIVRLKDIREGCRGEATGDKSVQSYLEVPAASETVIISSTSGNTSQFSAEE
ncbi:hypothetical protein FOZ62_029736, partial [Perkinsus olseni]